MLNQSNHNLTYIGVDSSTISELNKFNSDKFLLSSFSTPEKCYRAIKHEGFVPDTIICDEHLHHDSLNQVYEHFQKNIITRNIPFVVIMDEVKNQEIQFLREKGISDIIIAPLSANKHEILISTLIKIKPRIIKDTQKIQSNTFKGTPLLKRVFDILVAGTALICLSPLFLIISIALKLESKGPVFYYSKRVGSGYKVFNFYKIRSMYQNADQRLKDLGHLNQYANAEEQVTEPKTTSTHNTSSPTLYSDGQEITELDYISKKSKSTQNAFVKIDNDPRITTVGRFIRNTSIDELPQLVNVLKGDMSIVGNRPLPLYEAESLTTDDWSERFLAPAGITGLWQVKNRGKGGEMSSEERKSLDNQYAKNFSIWYDIKLIFQTIPALFQKGNV